jgi:hypothetical protein
MYSGLADANLSGVQYARVATACAVVAAAVNTAPLAASAAFGSAAP